MNIVTKQLDTNRGGGKDLRYFWTEIDTGRL